MYIFMLFVSGQADSSCPQYSCKKSSQTFTTDTCVYYTNDNSKSIPTYYSRGCDQSSNLTLCSTAIEGNATCVAPEVVPRFPGETCDIANPCIAGSECNLGKCQASGQFASNCTNNNECDVGLFCSADNKCEKQLALNSPCRNDYDCQNNAGCNITASALVGTCVEYYSIEAYESVAQCTANKSNLCETGYCVIYNGQPVCFGDAGNNRESPYTCETKAPCSSHEDTQLKMSIPGQCICGYNSERTKVCTLFNQDDEAKTYFSLLTDWSQGTKILKCHTLGRFGFQCMKENWGKYEEYLYKYYKVNFYQFHYFAEDCVLKAFLPGYYYAKKAYKDFSMIIGVSLAFISLV